MAGRVRRIDIALQRHADAIRHVAGELLAARLSAGCSQRAVAHAARISQSQLARIELVRNEHVATSTLFRVATAVGLKLVISLYPDGDAIRDAAQVDLLRRLRARLGTDWLWRYEVPVSGVGDPRAWDALGVHAGTHATFVVEAETRLRDTQALLRRISLKRAAAGDVRLLLAVSDTHNNRAVLAMAREMFAAEFPTPMRDAMRALNDDRRPDADAILVLAPQRGVIAPKGVVIARPAAESPAN
jgi:transcriptional regulator with XRE-family HTH domain